MIAVDYNHTQWMPPVCECKDAPKAEFNYKQLHQDLSEYKYWHFDNKNNLWISKDGKHFIRAIWQPYQD